MNTSKNESDRFTWTPRGRAIAYLAFIGWALSSVLWPLGMDMLSFPALVWFVAGPWTSFFAAVAFWSARRSDAVLVSARTQRDENQRTEFYRPLGDKTEFDSVHSRA